MTIQKLSNIMKKYDNVEYDIVDLGYQYIDDK